MKNGTHKKIRHLRKALGEGQAVFGDRFGVEQATVSRWEKGEAVARRYQDQLAELAGMTVAEFFHSNSGPRLIPIVGYVSGGESFTPVDDAPGTGYDHITLDIGDMEQVAVRVRGRSMTPVYRDGDIVIGSMALSKKHVAKAIGKDCIIMTMKGEGYLKWLRKGSKPGVYRLESYNPAFEDIADVDIDWVAPVAWVKRSA